MATIPVTSDTDTDAGDNYRPFGTAGVLDPETAVVCLLCGGVVSSVEANTHADWHAALNELLNP